MNLIQQISSNALQTMTCTLPSGASFTLTIYFRPIQQGWFINNLTYGSFSLNGMRITVSPNMLYQWRNALPFGLACFSAANREPTQQQDFLSGASKIYILSAAEVAEYTRFLSGV